MSSCLRDRVFNSGRKQTEKVQQFINANEEEEIVSTCGTPEFIDIVAQSFEKRSSWKGKKSSLLKWGTIPN